MLEKDEKKNKKKKNKLDGYGKNQKNSDRIYKKTT